MEEINSADLIICVTVTSSYIEIVCVKYVLFVYSCTALQAIRPNQNFHYFVSVIPLSITLFLLENGFQHLQIVSPEFTFASIYLYQLFPFQITFRISSYITGLTIELSDEVLETKSNSTFLNVCRSINILLELKLFRLEILFRIKY